MTRVLAYLLIFLLIPCSLHASLYIQHSLFYHTHDDDAENFNYSRMNNYLFIGASIDKKKKFYLGQSVHIWSKEHQADSSSQTSEISITELGPRFIWFLNDAKTWRIGGAWHPYAKGDRTIDGENQEVSGSSYMGSIAYHFKLSKRFYMGGSINYHAYTVDSKVVENTEEDVSESYTAIMPMLEFSIRFR